MKSAGEGTAEVPAWPRRHWRWLAAMGVALVLGAGIAVAASWHFSSAVLVPDHSSWPEDVRVEGRSPGRIVLSRSEDTLRPGVYGLVWQAGHAVIGAPVESDDDTVTRRLRDVHGYLVPGMEVAIDPEVYAGDPRQSLGLPSEDALVRGELGPMPAWLVSGRGDTWAIVVHGINGTPQVGLRILPTLRRAGMPALLIAYREDLGAPPSPDGFHHMGLTEWRDLESAARFALSRGARRLVLVGYSMGGSLVAQFMQNSALAPRVDGLVLDAPALDWQEILSFTYYRAPEAGHTEAWNVDPRLYERRLTRFLAGIGA